MRTIRLFLIVLIIGVMMAACQPQPPIGVIDTGSPTPPCTIKPDSIRGMSVDGTFPTDATFRWQASQGVFDPDDHRVTNYRSPPVVDVDTAIKISVEIISGNTRHSISADCTLLASESPPATATSEPIIKPTEQPPTPIANACPSSFQAMMERGQLSAIVRQNTWPLAFEEAGQLTGYEVALLREFARRWFGSPDAITFHQVLPGMRIPTLDRCDGDLIAAALTNTLLASGQDRGVVFSATYYTTGQQLLVRSNSAIESACDLEGKRVGITQGTTGRDNSNRRIAECSPMITRPELLEYADPSAAITDLLNGTIDAFTTDGLLLNHWAQRIHPGQLKIVGNEFSVEPYAIATRQPEKHSDEDGRLHDLINATLHDMQVDGTFGQIFCQWFPDEQPPQLATPPTADPELLQLARAATPYAGPGCQAPQMATTHNVEAGENLSMIAKRYYGNSDPTAWRAIYEANRAVIGPNPDKLPVGVSLTIPILPNG